MNQTHRRMLPNRNRIFVSQINSFTHQPVSLNFPEENDETMSDDFLPRALVEPDCAPKSDASPSEMEDEWTPGAYRVPAAGCKPPPPVPPRGAQARFPQTPFPSQTAPAATGSSGAPDHYQWAWAYPSYASGRQEVGYPHPHSMPSCLPSDEYSSYPGDGSHLQARSHSLPGRDSPSLASLEQPSSLLSNPPLAAAHPHQLPHPMLPYGCMPMAPACCTQYTPPGHHHHRGPGPIHQLSPQPAYHMPYKPSGPDQHHPGHVRTSSMQSEYAVPQPQHTSSRGTQLPMEQRKVFVTYESDSEDHVKEIIKFVALLRHNGFDTHIDVFEQQLNSISKIDCTERYIQEKDYLIIIAISPKYFEVVSGDCMFAERDERTLNTVYIHKQLQNEFIQNGCKNFRFIPVLFPGAKKSHVPTWLQNTHVYSWPKDRDDILRRLMRVEKYNPPPIGELPTIVSIPI